MEETTMRVTCLRLNHLGIGQAIGVALVSVGGRATAEKPVKIDVQSQSKTTAVGNTVTSEVTLKNAKGAPAAASRPVDVKIEMIGASGNKESQSVHFDSGATRAIVQWQVKDPGITHVR